VPQRGAARQTRPAGNRLNDGDRSFTYDARGRMVGSTTPIAAAYQVNALGGTRAA
jgi:YD repeat-containing protein